MSFADISKQQEASLEGNFKKVKFMRLTPGVHIIRILEPKAVKFRTHYVNSVTVKCLENECPICENNRNLISSFPDSFRKQSGFSPVVDRFAVNILDKTPAKVCPNCDAEYKDVSVQVCTCGTILPEAKPLNRVRLLVKGKALFEHLDTIHNAVLDSNGIPVGVNNFDITIVVNGTGKDVTYTPIPNPAANQPVEVSEDELFDKNRAVVELSPDELLALRGGVSLKDIFTTRNKKEGKSNEVVDSEEILPKDAIEAINRQVAELFGKK